MANFQVEYYESATARKQGKKLGLFFPEIEIAEVPEVSENLKGKVNANGEDMYEVAVLQRAKKVEKSILDAKCAACDYIRNIVGPEGVLVAYLVEEQEVK